MGDRVAAGIDVGGTKTASVLMSSTQEVMASAVDPTGRSATPDQVAKLVEAQVERMLREVDLTRDSLASAGVGLPGLISPDGRFINSIILPSWEDFDFGTLLHPRLGIPITIENDATMAALGHMVSLPKPNRPQCLVCLTLGTGVGGAILIGGLPFRGKDGTAGQAGHIVVDPGGRPCDCGNAGCLNAYASGTAIAARYTELIKMQVSKHPSGYAGSIAADLAQALKSGDPQARQAINEATQALGIAISGIVNLLNPEMVVIGGGVAALGSVLIKPIQLNVTQKSFSTPARRVSIRPAAYGPLTGAIGAAAAALEHGIRKE